MAPRKFEVGALVFAKVKGYPHWPARVEEQKPGDKYRILFFGTYELGTLDVKNLFSYEDHKTRFAKPNKKRFFKEALEEIEKKPTMMPAVTHIMGRLGGRDKKTADSPKPYESYSPSSDSSHMTHKSTTSSSSHSRSDSSEWKPSTRPESPSSDSDTPVAKSLSDHISLATKSELLVNQKLQAELKRNELPRERLFAFSDSLKTSKKEPVKTLKASQDASSKANTEPMSVQGSGTVKTARKASEVVSVSKKKSESAENAKGETAAVKQGSEAVKGTKKASEALKIEPGKSDSSGKQMSTPKMDSARALRNSLKPENGKAFKKDTHRNIRSQRATPDDKTPETPRTTKIPTKEAEKKSDESPSPAVLKQTRLSLRANRISNATSDEPIRKSRVPSKSPLDLKSATPSVKEATRRRLVDDDSESSFPSPKRCRLSTESGIDKRGVTVSPAASVGRPMVLTTKAAQKQHFMDTQDMMSGRNKEGIENAKPSIDQLRRQVNFLETIDARIRQNMIFGQIEEERALDAIILLENTFVTAAALIRVPTVLKTLRLVSRYPKNERLSKKAEYMYHKIKSFMMTVFMHESEKQALKSTSN